MNTFINATKTLSVLSGIVIRYSLDILCFIGCIFAVLSYYFDILEVLVSTPVTAMFAQCSSLRVAMLIAKQYFK